MAQKSGKKTVNHFLIACIILMTIVKLNLMGTGFLALHDEFRYLSSGVVLQDLSELEINSAIQTIFITFNRPADTIIKMIPSALQYATAHILELDYDESKNSYPLFIFNFIVYCLILLVHFKFSKHLLKDKFLALVSVLLFSSLTNSYMWIRHAMPYDLSLLIFYWLLYKTVIYTEDDRLSFTKSFLIGASSFFGCLIYPGYFPLFIIIFSILFFYRLTKTNLPKKILHSVYFGLGSIFCLAIFEGMSRLGGRSYISDALMLSGSIKQGSFEESFTFIIKYLFEVEGVTGIFLIIGLTLFYVLTGYQIIKGKLEQDSLIKLIAILFTAVFLAYASAGYFLHKWVFYGRLLHQYLPFICIFAVFAIYKLLSKASDKYEFVIAALALVFVFNFAVNLIHYKSFSYPRDVAWKLSKTNKFEDIENVCEYPAGGSAMPRKIGLMNPGDRVVTINPSPNIVVTNCCHLNRVIDLTKYQAYIPKDNYRLVETAPHFLNAKAYQYEGYDIVERKNMDQLNFQIKVFSKY